MVTMATVLLLMAAFLCACGSTNTAGLTVKVVDGRNTYVLKNSNGQTVSDILAFLGIELGTDDKVSMAADEKITADTTIEIKRKCTVTIINGEIEKTITCVGGTVQDALVLAKIKLKDTQTTNYGSFEPLEDGMIICVIRAGLKKDEPETKSEKVTKKNEKETEKTGTDSGSTGGNTEYYDGSDDDYYYDEPGGSGGGGGSYNPQPSPSPQEPETEGTTERYEISREIIYDLGDPDHGVIIITYSDLTQEEIRF